MKYFLESTSGMLYRSPTRIKNDVLRINWVTLRKTWNYSIVFISLYPTSVVNDGIKLTSIALESTHRRNDGKYQDQFYNNSVFLVRYIFRTGYRPDSVGRPDKS